MDEIKNHIERVGREIKEHARQSATELKAHQSKLVWIAGVLIAGLIIGAEIVSRSAGAG